MPPDALSDLIPPALADAVQAAADAQHRPAAEIVREALERYLREFRSPLSARCRQVLRSEELTDAELVEIVGSPMDVRHDHLDAELE